MANQSFGWQVTHNIVDAAKRKLNHIKDPQYAALLLIEFFLTMLIVGGIVLYMDGRFNQLQPPLNLFAFAAIVWAAAHFYNYTANYRFRRTNAIKRVTTMKTLALEFIIFLVVAISAFIYADPTINILPYPFNLALFLVILAVPMYFYIDSKFLHTGETK